MGTIPLCGSMAFVAAFRLRVEGAEVLSDVDAELAGLKLHRDKTQALKQGIMQELLA